MLLTTGVKRRSTSVTIYDLCHLNGCEDMTAVITDSLEPHATKEIPRYFLVLAQGKSIRKVVDQVCVFYVLNIRFFFLSFVIVFYY